MLLLATLLSIPWWLTVPAYFVIGTLWACFYLPRRVRHMSRAYVKWRNELLFNKPLKDVLAPETTSTRRDYNDYRSFEKISPSDFLEYRDHPARWDEYSEEHLLASFIANIAFWPIRIPQKILTDYMQSVWRAVVRLVRAIGRLIRSCWRAFVRICRWMYRYVISLYQAIILRANREAIADLKKLQAEVGK
ncbi:hypothetical protein G3A43_08135 [Paraburkholderia aspalathi]|nr:hypothetical protein [Paraburkholderia aspalathi]MBK3780224.1 hypothetical protein [Paraburkholderia aspalathi]